MEKYCPICDRKASLTGIKLGSHEIYRCPDCSFHFAPTAFELEVNYSHIYQTAEYATQVKEIERIAHPAKFGNMATYRPFFKNVKHRDEAQLLDVGCGVGRFCHAAHTRRWKVTGIDISEAAIDIGSRYSEFPLRVSGLEEAVRLGERYDVVTAFEVLEHIPAPKSFIRLMVNATSSSGQVFCTVPNWECRSVQTATRPDWIPPIHIGFFTRKSLMRLGASTGCKTVRTGVIYSDSFHPTPAGLARWLARRVRLTQRVPLGLWLHLAR